MNSNAPRNESQIAYHRRRADELKGFRTPWEADWRKIAAYIEPTRLRMTDRLEGSVSRAAILDSSSTFAWRTLKSGMHSGVTSPARPWFRLGHKDRGLRDYAPVKQYLSEVEALMRSAFQGSNIYPAFHTGYGDNALFGQSCALLIEDDDRIIRMQQLLHGRFWIARDHHGRATTLYRVFRWSVQRIVGRFGYDKCSGTIKRAYDQSKYDETFNIWHAVEPRMNRNPRLIDKANKPFLSNYWEEIADGKELLEESGFDSNPIIAPSWEAADEDTYSTSPGSIALSDAIMLQKEQLRKLEGIDKKVRPPMTGPTSMRNNPASLLPGAITYSDDPAGKGFRPAMEVNLSLSELALDIRDVTDRLNRAMFADLFMQLANMEGVQPRNVMELAERKEEKLLQLGPVLENIYNGQLEPVIDRTFQLMNRRGLLPPPPPELEDQELEIEYISILAQAQKAVGTGGIERGMGFVGQLAAVKPDVLDKIDADEAVDQYFDMLGVNPSIVVPDDDVAKVRAARSQKQAQAEGVAMAAEAAPAAKAGAEAASVLSSAMNNPGGGDLLRTLGIG